MSSTKESKSKLDEDTNTPANEPSRESAKSIRPLGKGPLEPQFDTVESAAAKLRLDKDALRARCRRAAQSVGDTVTADLGGGIVAFKFGRSWRLTIP